MFIYAVFDKTNIQSLNFHPRCPVALKKNFVERRAVGADLGWRRDPLSPLERPLWTRSNEDVDECQEFDIRTKLYAGT